MFIYYRINFELALIFGWVAVSNVDEAASLEQV